ncbi:MAG: Ig-like domain-containing protein, partial [Bacteroidota bacterium]
MRFGAGGRYIAGNCGNGIDDDGDGFVDCYDEDCFGSGECEGFIFGYPSPSCSFVPPPGQPFGLNKIWQTDPSVAKMDQRQTPLVADIDNDGIPEVIGKDDNPGRIYIFDGRDGSLEVQINTSRQDVFHDAPTVADVDGDGFGEIFITTHSRRIERYEHTGGARTWQSPVIGYRGNDRRWTLGIADFDEDGVPEVYGGNQVYSSVNGLLIASGGSANQLGSHAGASSEPFSVAIDVLEDAACANCAGLELVAGGQVYSVDVTTGTMQVETSAPSGLGDGFTSVADFDQDGDLDGVVNQGGEVYVWDLQTSTQIGVTASIPTTTRGGHPNVADFDSDGKPEIGVAGTSLYAIIDDLDLGMPIKWNRPTNDNSQMTGSTVYDFHGDGFFEVIYSDEDSLYIYNGVDGSKLASIYCASGTRTEYPVVADVNADGQVEILCACQNTPGPNNSGNDYITLFRTSDYPWISARQVWNQHNYFEVNINDDLSVPREMQKHHLVKGSNNFLAQSTFRLGGGEPALAAPDGVISLQDLTTDIDFTNCGSVPSTIDLTIRITNQGDWPFPAGMPVTLYDGNPFTEAASVVLVDSARSTVGEGSFTDVTYTIPEPVGSYDLYLLINDNGSQSTPIAEATTFVGECDYTNNLSGPYTINGCNIAPLVDLDVDNSSGALGNNYDAIFTAGDSDQPISDPDISILDTDVTVDFVTITLTNRPNGTDESLSVSGALPPILSITDPYDDLTGQMVISGPASTADFVTAISQIVYNNTSPALSIDLSERTIEVVANDGLDNSNTAVATLQVLTAESPKIDLDGNDDSGFAGINFGNDYTEGGSAAVGDVDVVIADLDDVNLTQVTFVLTNRPDGSSEALAVSGALPGDISVDAPYDPATGQLVLSNGASIADYQTAIAQVVYTNSSSNPTETTRVVEVFVSDDDARLSNKAIAYINVNSLPEAPMIDLDADNSSLATGSDYDFIFDPSGLNRIVDSDLSITDSDVGNMVSADIQLINKPEAGNEGLRLSATAVAHAASVGVSITDYNPISGLLSLDGTAAIADYETVIKGIEYFNNVVTELEEERRIDIYVHDGTDRSNVARSTITSMSAPRAGFGTGLDLDGSNDYIAITDYSYASTNLTEVTVEAWIRTTSEGNQVIASFDRSEYWRLEVNGASAGDGLLGWGVDTNSGTLALQATTYISDGQWHHVAGVYDNGEGRIYVDGALQGTTTRGVRFGSGQTRFGFIGTGSEANSFNGSRGPNDEFNGQIDEVRIWSIARTSEEIKQSIYSQLTGAEPGLEVYYEFEEGSGLNTVDRTGSGNNGLLVNMDDGDWLRSYVTPGNAIADQQASSGVLYTLVLPQNTFFHRNDDIQDIQVTLGNGDPMPTWLSFDALSSTLSGTPSPTDQGEVVLRARATDSNGSLADDVFRLTVSLSPPTLNSIGVVKNTDQNTQVSVTFDEIAAEADEADVDGTVEAFIVQNVDTGTLRIGTDETTAVAFSSGINDVIDANLLAFWTPPLGYSGTGSAFTVLARDNDNLLSAAPVALEVLVNATNTAPTIEILGAPAVVSTTAPYRVTFEFSEDVFDFEASDINVDNGVISNFAAEGGNTYTADVTPDGLGNIAINVNAAAAQDASGLDNTSALEAVTIFDDLQPTVDIEGEPAITNATDPFTVTIRFSEAVSGFEVSDVVVQNALASNFQATASDIYTIDITPTGAGDVAIDVNGAVATDVAGNANSAAFQAVIIFDNIAPVAPTVTAQVTNDATPVLSGTAEASSTVLITVGGATYT